MPMIISQNPVIWFKQDDTFNQPFAFVQIKIETADCLFPLTPQSQIFSSIWKSCLNESLREIGYMAQLAGQGSGVSLSSDYLTVGFSGYNDGIQNYMQEVMKLIQTYTVTEQFFNDKKALMIRQIENELK